MTLAAIPSLDDLARDPAHAAALAPDVARALLVRASAVTAALETALRTTAPMNGSTPADEPEDKLLSIEEAMAILHRPRWWMYAHAAQIPGARRVHKRLLLFSERRLRAWAEAERAADA